MPGLSVPRRDPPQGELGCTAKEVRLGIPVYVDQLASDEPLSPEVVLVLPPALRAQALARLGAPVWHTPRPRVMEPPAPPVEERLGATFGQIVLARVVQLAVIFALVTALTLAMSVVAHAIR
jgi:hypothetical protein